MIAETILKYRHKKKFTQEELAELAVISTRQLQRIENYECQPSYDTLKRLIFILDITNNDVVRMVKGS